MCDSMYTKHNNPLLSIGISVFLLVSLLCGVVEAKKPYEENRKKRGFHPFLSAKKDTPAEQLAYANEIREKGKRKKAQKQYYVITVIWPDSVEAPAAQMAYADIMLEREKYKKAFDEYQYLIDNYAGRFPYDQVLEKQFEIALHIMTVKKGKWLFGGFDAPERATALFEQIVQNGPEWEKAPEAQYLIGKIFEMTEQYELAIIAYMTANNRYPESKFAEAATFGGVKCLYLLAQESPQDMQALENAWAAILLFQQRYPLSDNSDVIQEYKKTIYRDRAKAAYDVAYFYDYLAKKPRAALTEYENFIRLFPDSDWTGIAEVRIDVLKTMLETTNE